MASKNKKKKHKIRKSIQKRIRITKTGKVLFRGSHIRHLRRKKSKGQIRSQKIPHQLHGKWKGKVKKILGAKSQYKTKKREVKKTKN